MKKLAVIAAFAASASLITGIAIAKDGPRERMFQRADLNGDGQITQAEAASMRAERFDRIDSNADQAVTLEEMQAAARRRSEDRVARHFERLDSNADGVVQRSEYEEKAAARFNRMDANGDGAITIEEARAMKGRRGG